MTVFNSYISQYYNWHNNAMVEKHKMSKDLQTVYKFNMCNYTLKLTFLLLNFKKRCKRDKEQHYAVDGHGPATIYARKVQGLKNFRTSFVMLK